MKKNILLTAIILITCFKIYAQSNSTVSGQIIDKKTKEFIAYASVVILSDNNELVNGCISENDGFFSMKGLEFGNYKLKVSFIGYNTHQSNILKHKCCDLG